jgi:DNA-binding CsgD family transcriptional regulator
VALVGELLERSSQLASLDDQWATVRKSGQGRLVLIGGEAGSGKSTFVKAFCEAAVGRPTVLTGMCDLLSSSRPLGPFLDLASELGESASSLEVAGRPDEVARSLLSALSGRSPTVIVLEDLHWADEATVDVIRILARRVTSTPVLMVATYRDDELNRMHPLRILLGDIPDKIVRIRIPPFTRAAVDVLASSAGLDGSELFAKTAGNPFFVTEILAAGADIAADIPETVRDAVLARAGRLGEQAQHVLDAVAVASPPTEVWLLEAMVDELEPGLGLALQAGMLTSDAEGVAFRHELARLAILEMLSPARATSLHRKSLTALMDPPIGVQDVSRLAHHAQEAGDAEATVRFAEMAAEQAALVGAHREAAELYARVLRYREKLEPNMLAALLDKHAHHSYQADRDADAVASARAAADLYFELGDTPLAVGALLRLATIQRTAGLGAEARRTTASAHSLLETVPSGAEQAMAFAALALVAMCDGEYQDAMRAGMRAVEIAESIGDDSTLLHARISMSTVQMESPSCWEAGYASFGQCIAMAKERGYHDLAGRAYNNLGYELLYACRLDLLDGMVDDAVAYHTRWGGEVWLNCALTAQAELQLARGQWDAAVDSAQRILQGSVTGARRLQPLVVIALIRARRGDPDPWSLLDEALGLAKQGGDLQMVAPVAAARAEVAWLENDQAAVLSESEACVRTAMDSGYDWALGTMPYWRWQVGIREPAAERDTTPRGLQMAGRAMEAAARWEELGFPYEAALALADSGEESALRDALDRLQSMGARAAALVVAQRLRALGAKRIPRGPNRAAAANPAGLTAREMEVLALVVEGLRDAQIAERLFLSEKTVGHHVSSILRKLAIESRGQAAAAAGRLGVL